jgi:hypothetical protein
LGATPVSEQKPRSRNVIISWENLNPEATKSTIAQDHQKVGSIFRIASSLPMKAFYKIFKLLFEGAKFLTKSISGLRKRLRS